MTKSNVKEPEEKAREFLVQADQFKLGRLLTEASHPATADLSHTARTDIPAALAALFTVDQDVLDKYRAWSTSEAPHMIAARLIAALRAEGRIFFTGCGATGRLSILLEAVWRGFWQHRTDAAAREWEHRVRSVMAGGDFALIKSVEGFEDFAQFGRRQMRDAGVKAGDVVFAITEGGETSFVIGTAWEALAAGAAVYFVYNNPDQLLREAAQRSRAILDEPAIVKINLTTGPMALAGSTRMQATSIQLCVLLTLLEMAARELIGAAAGTAGHPSPARAPDDFCRALEHVVRTLRTPAICTQLAGLVALEEAVYRRRRCQSYFADRLALDVLTDTTERSPTFCTPAFRKFGDCTASEAWSYLYTAQTESSEAWQRLLKREIKAVQWDRAALRAMVPGEAGERLYETVTQISREEILRFRLGLDGLSARPIGAGDGAACIIAEGEEDKLLETGGFYRLQIAAAAGAGAETGLVFLGRPGSVRAVQRFLQEWRIPNAAILVVLPEIEFLLADPVHVAVKMLLNALSTCTMARIGRILGNMMVWVAPTNLKLIDRATRYIAALTGRSYEESCLLLFRAVDYLEPRRRAGQDHPAAVALAVTQARRGASFADSEQSLSKGGGRLPC